MTTPKNTPPTPDEREPYDRAARRLADNRHGNQPDNTNGYPLHDDIRRATYPDPKVAYLKGESPIVQQKRELAEQDRGDHTDAPSITNLPDGTPAGNTEAVAHNKAVDAKTTVDPADEETRAQDQKRDTQQAREAAGKKG